MKCGKMPKLLLRAALDEMGVDYFEAEGEAAFYGPKIGYPGEDCPWKRRNPLYYPARLLAPRTLRP